MDEFSVARNRDASPAILGFCYQVDCTIERWLRLESSQWLELERGEDIDIVAKAILGSGQSDQRQLEQVKRLSSRLSLRSKEVLGFLANAVEHREANPGHALVFRFVTNSEITTERPAAFDDRESAIKIWSLLRLKKLPDRERTPRLAGLRALLRSAKRPKALPATTWTNFQAFLNASDDSGLGEFIDSVEWSMSNLDADGMRHRVCEILQEHGFCRSIAHAEEFHGRLFVHTIRLLAQPGRKSLTKADLVRQATASPPTDAEKRILRELSAHVTSVTTRLDTLENLVQREHATLLSRLIEQITSLATAESIPAELLPKPIEIDIACPPRSPNLCQREAVVESLRDVWQDDRCLFLRGAVGTGKTQLGLLLLDKLHVDAAWLALRDQSATETKTNILHGLRVASGQPLGTPLPSILRAFKDRGRSGIVLDDLPAFAFESPLGKVILDLIRSGSESKVPILVLTHHPLPHDLQTLVASQVIERVVPSFSVNEARDLFRMLGANSEFCSSPTIEALNNIAGGHPWMLVAVARFFGARQWQISSDDLDAIGDFIREDSLLDHVVRRVVATVEDSESRSLLYRLGLTIRPFHQDTVRIVSLVEPIVGRPRERLVALSGLWVERRSDTTMSVSPLIRPLADSELSPELNQSVLLRLGEDALKQSKLSLVDLSSALHYFSSAGAYSRVSLILIVALKGSSRLPRTTAKKLLALSKIPQEGARRVTRGLRIYLSAERIRLASRLGKPIEHALRSLFRRCERVDRASAWAAFSSAVTLSPLAATVDFPLGLKFVELACRSYQNARIPNSRKRLRIQNFEPEFLFWQIVPSIATADDLSAWLDFLEVLPDSKRQQTLDWPQAEEGIRVAISKVWMTEFEQPPEKRDWERVLSFYEHVVARADGMGIESIWAEAVASIIVIHADYKKNLAEAIHVAVTALARNGLADLSRYRIVDSLGRQFVYHRQFTQAKEWLEQSFTLAGDYFPSHRAWSYLELARALGETDRQAAIPSIQNAIELARTQPRRAGSLSLAISLGEMAIAQWRVGDLNNCFRAFDEAVETFLSCKDGSIDWKQRFACVGHAASFFALLASTGEPPKTTRDGSRFAPPQPGLFMSFKPELLEFYDEDQTVLIYALMANFAQGIGEDERAGDWGLRGFDRARSIGNLVAVQQLNSFSFPALLRTGQYVDALDAAVEASHATVALMERYKRGDAQLASRLTVPNELGPKPNGHWDFAERQSVRYGVVPLVMHIAGLIRRGKDMQEPIQDVLDLLTRYAERASDPQCWPNVVKMFRAIFVEPMPRQDLMQMANTVGTDERSQVRMLGYLGVSLLPDTSIEAAAIGQAIVMQDVTTTFVTEPTTYRSIMLPFICDFWKNILENQRFRFASPGAVQDEFETAIQEPPDRRAQAVFRAIFTGLKITLSKHPQIADWLRS